MKTPLATGGGQRVTVGEIAEMAGVLPSAVSNWRSRHDDFPLPVEGGDLFDLNSIEAWLQSKGKHFQRPVQEWDRLLWTALGSVRGEMPFEHALLMTLQLLYLVDRARRGATGAAEALKALRADPNRAVSAWQDIIARLSLSTPENGRAFEWPSRLQADRLTEFLHAVEQLGNQHVDTGETATALIERYQDSIGMRGVGSTSPSLAHLQVALLTPIEGVVYDPAAGTAMVLAKAWRQRANDQVKLIGQEVNEFNWRLAFLHLSLLDASFKLATGDTLRDDRFRTMLADRIAADPPFAVKPHAGEMFMDDRWVFGVPRNATDWLWAQHLIHHLSDDGIGVLTVPLGALWRSGSEAEIRAGILNAGLLDAVIELPPNLIAGTSQPIALLLFAKNRRGRAGEVLFVNASQLGQPRRGKPHELEPAEVERIVSAVRAWRDSTWVEEPRFTGSAVIPEILANGADLLPKRYLRLSTRVTEIEGEQIGTRLERLRSTMVASRPDLQPSMDDFMAGAEMLSAGNLEDWPLVRLGDLIVVKPRAGTRQDLAGDNAPVPFIATELVSGGTGRLITVPDEVTRGRTRDRLVARGDLLLVSRGITADRRVGCATVDFDGAAAYSESLLLLRPDADKVEADFLRLFLTSRQGRDALFAATTGSVISNLRPDAVVEIEVRLPDRATQHSIVAAMRLLESGVNDLSAVLATSRDLLDTIREGVASGILGGSEA